MTEQEIASYKEQIFEHSPTHTPTSSTVPAAETPIVETPTTDLVPTDTPTDTPAVTDTPTSTVDYNTYIKEQFGFETVDEAKTKIAELNALKEAASKPIEYANEESKKVHELLLAGKVKEVKAIYDAQEKLDEVLSLEVSESTAESILKTGMQFRYKDLTPQQIEHKFNKQYGIPKEPNEDKFLTKDEYEDAKEEWEEKVNEIKMDRIIDAKLLKPELEKSKSEIKLPEIPSESNSEFEQFKTFKQSQQDADKKHEEVCKVAGSISEQDVPFKLNFNDEAKKVAFEVTYQADKEGFDKAKETAFNHLDFSGSIYQKQDGSPDLDKIKTEINGIYKLQNFDKIVTEAVNQAVNETMLQMARNQKNIGDGHQRNFNMVQPDALQKLKEQVFGN